MQHGKYTYTALAAIGALCLLVIVGWFVESPAIVQLHPTWVPMQFNTALGLMLGAIALVLPKKYSGIVAGFVAGLGAVTLLQYIIGANFGVDTAVVEPFTTVETSHPGRMSPISCISFMLLGFAALYIHTNRAIAATLLSVVLALGFVSALGYATGLSRAYGWGGLTDMAMHTSVVFMALSVVTLVLVWRGGSKEWVPVPVFILLFAISVLIARALNDHGIKGVAVYTALVLGACLAVMASATSHYMRLAVVARDRARKKASMYEGVATLDPLTQCLNRRGVNRELPKMLARAMRDDCGLYSLVVDIDDFKAVNTKLGHDGGDAALVSVTTAIRGVLRGGDEVARHGGDEFVVLFLATDRVEAMLAAERIRLSVMSCKVEGLPITASMALLPVSHNFSELVKLSARALAESKRKGKNQVTEWLSLVTLQG